MLVGIVDLWFLFVALSLAFTVYDIQNTAVSWVQKLGWMLVILYTGPFGLFFYFLTCRNPGRDWHALYTQATWKQAINSEVHCAAGDATGVILAAVVLSYYVIPMNIEIVLEYIFGFISGWLIFQAGMMLTMFKSYKESLIKTFFPEAVSMNFMMLGMIPTMIYLMPIVPNSTNPSYLNFWFVMGMGTLMGGVIAYPINYWLVKNKLKHGCMTIDINTNIKMSSAMPHHESIMNSETHSTHQPLALSLLTKSIIVFITFFILIAGIILTQYLFPMHHMAEMSGMHNM